MKHHEAVNRRANRLPIFWLIACLSFEIQALGQSPTTGSISGFVQDETGAVLPGVEIQAIHEDTGLSGKTISTETGSYTISIAASREVYGQPFFARISDDQQSRHNRQRYREDHAQRDDACSRVRHNH